MFTKRVLRLFTFVLLCSFAAQFFGIQNVSAAKVCDWAQYVADVSVPDGTTFTAGTPFIKTWRVKNIGSCTWTTAYTFVYFNGDSMGAPASVPLPKKVGPGQTVDISVPMTAPATLGSYRGFWKFLNASGQSFGIGAYASDSLWVDIRSTSQQAVIYDFTADVCSAIWAYDGGAVPCPFKPNMSKYGEITRFASAMLENGQDSGLPTLVTVPQQKFNGYIHGVYPAFRFDPGDHFQAMVGCEYGAVKCNVIFQLQYLTKEGELVTIWKFKEKYDGKLTWVDIDLSRYAYKPEIRLVLTAFGAGSSVGDRAMWVQPKIVRPSAVVASAPIVPTVAMETPTVTPTVTPTSTPVVCIDSAAMLADVNIPDGTTFTPGSVFTKTWRLQNTGTCSWGLDYSLVYAGGEKMNGPASAPMPLVVLPGQSIDLSVNLTAPTIAGMYQGNWMLRNAVGVPFGIGSDAKTPFWVKINVAANTAVASGGYDFVANVCSAKWQNASAVLPCPGADGDARGFVFSLPAPLLESGAVSGSPALLTFPENSSTGYVRGVYPEYFIQNGDHFQLTVSCENNQTGCNVLYEVGYQVGAGPIQPLWVIVDWYDGQAYSVDLDLGYLAGQTVKFVLTTYANGYPAGDRALWVAPRIVNVLPVIAPTTETPTLLP